MLLVFSQIVHLQVLPTLPEVIIISTVNITKGSEIKPMKELQPSVIQSCCREDRHWNNQVDIKSGATTKYLQRYIYYRGSVHRAVHTDQCTGHVCTCFYQLGVDNES